MDFLPQNQKNNCMFLSLLLLLVTDIYHYAIIEKKILFFTHFHLNCFANKYYRS